MALQDAKICAFDHSGIDLLFLKSSRRWRKVEEGKRGEGGEWESDRREREGERGREGREMREHEVEAGKEGRVRRSTCRQRGRNLREMKRGMEGERAAEASRARTTGASDSAELARSASLNVRHGTPTRPRPRRSRC